MPWRPISELKPVLRERYIVAKPGDDWYVAKWKMNSRLDPPAHRALTNTERAERAQFVQPYFGHPEEMDDYDEAKPENAPTLYYAVDAVPSPAELAAQLADAPQEAQ